jgi:hypothetical protein
MRRHIARQLHKLASTIDGRQVIITPAPVVITLDSRMLWKGLMQYATERQPRGPSAHSTQTKGHHVTIERAIVFAILVVILLVVLRAFGLI